MVREYYNSCVEREWNRLIDHWMEYETTYHQITSRVSPESRILDIGGGPGRYSLNLAEKGYSMFLADLSEENIRYAKELDIKKKLNGCEVLDATDLSLFPDNEFDAVLCLGPFYHLPQKEDRTKVVNELFRVVKPEGLVFSAFITHYAIIHDILRKDPSRLSGMKELVDDIYYKGYNFLDPDSKGFPHAFFISPDDIEAEFSTVKYEKIDLIGCEPFSAQNEGKIASLGNETKDTWIEFAHEISNTPFAIYNSEHLLHIARKKG